jgi:hypothetical protein
MTLMDLATLLSPVPPRKHTCISITSQSTCALALLRSWGPSGEEDGNFQRGAVSADQGRIYLATFLRELRPAHTFRSFRIADVMEDPTARIRGRSISNSFQVYATYVLDL